MDALEKEGCDRIFCDQGESGAKASRPEWDNCLDHLRKGDTLVIWKLDRASRSTKHLREGSKCHPTLNLPDSAALALCLLASHR
ncbi:MAG: recombinase family protein [Cyanobacteria bacterium J06581_3]